MINDFFSFQKIDTEIRQKVDEAVKKAKAEKEIDNSELAADVYSEPLETHIRGVSQWDRLPHLRIGEAVNYK